jgi:hypothetical protein
MSKTICLALTGASGMPYGLRLLECLLDAGCTVQLLYSQASQVVAKQEMDIELPSRPSEAKAALLARFPTIDPENWPFLAAKNGSPRSPPAPTRPTPWLSAPARWAPWPPSPRVWPTT